MGLDQYLYKLTLKTLKTVNTKKHFPASISLEWIRHSSRKKWRTGGKQTISISGLWTTYRTVWMIVDITMLIWSNFQNSSHCVRVCLKSGMRNFPKQTYQPHPVSSLVQRSMMNTTIVMGIVGLILSITPVGENKI